jgi:hypothetical protein
MLTGGKIAAARAGGLRPVPGWQGGGAKHQFRNDDYKIAGVPVSILGLTLPALTFALTLSGQGAAIRLLRLRCQSCKRCQRVSARRWRS